MVQFWRSYPMAKCFLWSFFVLLASVNGSYAQKTWTGSVNSDWGTGGNWNPAGVPSSGQNVSIPNTTNIPTVNGNYTINNLTISSSWGGGEVRVESGSLTVNGTLAINGQGILRVNGGELLHQGSSFTFAFGNYNAVRIAGGLLRTNATNFVINSGMEMSGGVFEANAGMAVASGKSFTATGGIVRVSGHLNIQSSNSNFYAGDSLIVNGRLTLSGSTNFYGGNAGIVVNRVAGQNNQLSGNWFTQQAHVVFNPSNPIGTNLTSISSSGAQFRVGQGTVVFNDSIFVGSNATLFADSGTTTIAKNLQVSSSGTVTNQIGTINFLSGAVFTNTGTLNAGAGQVNFGGNVVVNNSGGTINADSSTIVITGDLSTPGTFNPGTSTVVLAGDSDQVINNDIVFYNLEIQTAGSLQANGNITVLNDGVIGDSTTIDLGQNQLNVQGDLTDNGGNLAVATDRPFVVAAAAASSTSILIEFNEALNATANNASNYVVTPGLTVTAANVNGKFVTLTVTPAMSSQEYTITINNVENLANVAINDNHIKRFGFVLITTPSVQPADFVITTATASSIALSWTRGNGASVLVIARRAAAPTNPSNGTGYTANTVWQAGTLLADSSFAVYAGSGTSATITGLEANNLYFFKIFEQNGSSSTTAYLIGDSNTVRSRFTLPQQLTTDAEVAAVSDTSCSLNFTRGAGSGVLVLARRGSPVTAVPASGQNYNANPVFGLGADLGDSTFVVAATAANNVEIQGLSPNERYYFAWFDYNGEGVTRSYLGSAAEALALHTFLRLQLRFFLEGPFSASADSMKTQLGDLIPVQQPFNQLPWQYGGAEMRAVAAADVVDWVYVQLRQSNTAANAVADSVVFEQACLLRSDGWLMDVNGDTAFIADITRAGNQYAVLFPRTHLPALASSPLLFNGNAHAYDFSNAQSQTVSVAAVKQLANNRWALAAGDVGASEDFTIELADVLAVWQSRNLVGVYQRTDLNLDGQVDATDRSLVWNNRGRSSTLPE